MALCSDCGFLTLRNAPSGTLLPADQLYRENGHPSPIGIADIVPLCFMRQRDFRTDFVAIRAAMQEAIVGQRVQIEDHKVMQEVLALDQPNCREWTPWLFGFAPREHREMLDRLNAARNQQKRDLTNLAVAMTGVVVAVVGIVVGAVINLKAAEIQRDGQPTINVIAPTAAPASR